MSFIDKIPNFIRWLLVPVVVVLTALIVWLVAGILAKIFIFMSDSRYGTGMLGENFFDYILIPGLGSFSSVIAAAIMAPKFEKIVAITVGCFWLMISGGMAYAAFILANWPGLLVTVSISVGCWMAVNSGEYYASRVSVTDEQ